MKSILAGLVLATMFGTAAYADYYIVQEPTTKRCHIVEQRPTPGAGVVIGSPFGVRIEAEQHMRTVKVCHDETTGRGRGSDKVIIHER